MGVCIPPELTRIPRTDEMMSDVRWLEAIAWTREGRGMMDGMVLMVLSPPVPLVEEGTLVELDFLEAAVVVVVADDEDEEVVDERW